MCTCSQFFLITIIFAVFIHFSVITTPYLHSFTHWGATVLNFVLIIHSLLFLILQYMAISLTIIWFCLFLNFRLKKSYHRVYCAPRLSGF